MAIVLQKSFDQSATYIADSESNFTVIEDNINTLLVASSSGSGSALAVPAGLQQIFDRDGVVGIESYQLTDQTVVADLLTIPAGAAWTSLTWRAKTTSTVLDTTTLATGTRYINVDSGGNPVLSTTSTIESVYSFAWDSGTKVISSTTLLIDILFDGSDYNDCLDSAAQSKNFTSLADRLEDIESQIGAISGFYAQDLGTTTGLTFGYQAGTVRNDNVLSDTAAGTLAMTDNDDNYVELNGSTGAITSNLTGFTSGRIPCFIVTTLSAAITVVNDRRTWAALGGVGGSHTQNTDTGTDATTFTLNALEAGTPSANVSLDVERGTSANVDIRWNETTDKWEFTNNGTTYQEIGTIDIGTQELTKTVIFENPPLVLSLTGQSTSGAYAQVDVTADPDFTSIVAGLQGMILRVVPKDSAPAAGVDVKFRKIENPLFSPTVAYTVLANDSTTLEATSAHTLIVNGEGFTVGDVLKVGFEYFITASGAGTFDLDVYVLGYMEKVTGTGSQDKTFSSVGNVVAGSSTVQFDLPLFGDRSLVHSFTINETTGTPALGYNVKTYKKDTFLTADLTYRVDGIIPAPGADDWVDTLPFMEVDEDVSAELHVSIENLDTSSGTYDITVRMERFA